MAREAILEKVTIRQRLWRMGWENLGVQSACRPQGMDVCQGLAQTAGWLKWNELEGLLRAEDGKVVGRVQGQTVRSRLRVECLEVNVRAIVFICRGKHWRLLIKCEMWSRACYCQLTITLPQTQFHASYSMTTTSCLFSLLPLETQLQWFFDPVRTSSPLISAPFSLPLFLDVFTLFLRLVKAYGQSINMITPLTAPKIPLPFFLYLMVVWQNHNPG